MARRAPANPFSRERLGNRGDGGPAARNRRCKRKNKFKCQEPAKRRCDEIEQEIKRAPRFLAAPFLRAVN
jgi:hypothetical protein